MIKSTTKTSYVLVNKHDKVASLEMSSLNEAAGEITARVARDSVYFKAEMPYTIHEIIKTRTIRPYVNPEGL